MAGDTRQQPNRKPSAPLRLLTVVILMPLIALATMFFGCISLIVGLWDSGGRQQHSIARIWARTLLWIALSPVSMEEAHKLRLHPVAVYVSNHLSYMDTPVLFAKLPFQFRILAKQSLWKIPFIGWYLNHSGQVPVDSSNSRSAVAGLLRGVATLKSGLPLVLFPEGGRTPNGHLHTMQSGSAWMAIRAQVPIVPIALIGTYELLRMHTYILQPRPLRILVGDPIPTIGLSTRDADALTQQVHDAIATAYYRYADFDRPAPGDLSQAFSTNNQQPLQPQPDRNQEG
jgi:1-acyl-sn-glycerol-3-phosphate acyltransferase